MENRYLKIAFVDHAPIIGGSQIALLRHLKHLDLDKFQPFLITNDLSPQYRTLVAASISNSNTTFVRFPRLKPFSLKSLFQYLSVTFTLFQKLRQLHPNIIVANGERPMYSCVVISFLLRTKLIVYVRDFEYSHALLKLVNNQIDYYLPVSQKIADFYHLPQNKYSVVHVSSDISNKLAQVTDEQVRLLSNRYNIPQNCYVIGYISRIVKGKGPFMLVDAYQRFLKDSPDHMVKTRLVIVGDGSDLDELKAWIRQQNMSSQIITVGYDPNVALWYRLIHVFVHSSIYADAYATSIIEAAFAKLPIIATNTGGTAEFVIDQVTGLLVEPSAEGIHQALTKMYTNQKQAHIMATNAHQKAQQENIEGILTQQIERIYLGLV